MLYFLIAIICLIVIYIIVQYNILVKASNIVKEAFSTMDVYLKKRWDLIPNLVEVVKSYSKHEENVFSQITALRTGRYDDMTGEKKISINEQITESISKIMAIAESYPELKANQNYLDLSKNLVQIENEIANSRKYYNGAVRAFNNKVQMFPSNIIASIFGFKQAKSFEANIEERNNIEVSL